MFVLRLKQFDGLGVVTKQNYSPHQHRVSLAYLLSFVLYRNNCPFHSILVVLQPGLETIPVLLPRGVDDSGL